MNFQELCKEINFNKLITLAEKHEIEIEDRDLNYYKVCLESMLGLPTINTDEERVIHLEKDNKDWYEVYFVGPDEDDETKKTNYSLDFQPWDKVASYKIMDNLTKEEQFLLALCVFDDLTFYGLD